ncbi:hypothetical protein AB0M36_24120 [Actinoplanes sp. NPDC051346]|uniref:hypothetical protein n=1 Tax=Actinoplanes sp. NPDC051346 TaxID=3155048 RepID=UPI00341492C4
MNDDKTPQVPRWAILTIVTLAASLAAVLAGILTRWDGASLAGAVRNGGAAFVAAAGVLLAMAAFLGGSRS